MITTQLTRIQSACQAEIDRSDALTEHLEHFDVGLSDADHGKIVGYRMAMVEVLNSIENIMNEGED